MNKLTEIKYSKGHSGKQCIGPCYKNNTPYLHPITLDRMLHPIHNTCPTYKWWNNEFKMYQTYDTCNLDKNSMNKYDILNILSPSLTFDENQFIKLHYNIHTFDSGVEWLTNNISNYYSSIRISECLWRIYGNSTSILSNKFIKYYIDFIKLYWIDDVYKKLKKYIIVQNDNIQFASLSNGSTEHNKIGSKYRIPVINFIVDKFITPNNIYTVLYKYIKSNNKNWENVEYHNNNILDNLINYCTNNIKNYDV